MVSVNSINSQMQVGFGRRKKEANAPENNRTRPMIKWGDKGGKKNPEEKYEGVHIDETTAPIIYGDYYLDKAIEATLAGATFLVAALKGTKLLHGVTGGFVDATKQLAKNGKMADGIKQTAKRYFATVGEAMKTAKKAQAEIGKLPEAIEANKAVNANNVILKDSIVYKFANQADKEGSLVSNVANLGPVKKVILGAQNNAENAKVSSQDLGNFLAKKGITRGADIVDIGAAGAGAYGLSIGGRDFADIMTDLNDDDVVDEATAAARKKAIEEDVAAIGKQFGTKAGRLAKAGFELYEML